MKLSLFNLILITLVFISCSVEKDEVTIPENILANEEMVTILTECYLAEGASGINVKAVTGQNIDSFYLFNPIKDNNCSKGKFDSSVSFYSKHPVMLKQIYYEVLEKLNKTVAKGKYDK